jgi:MFS family permease
MRWWQGLERYCWVVLIVAALGWLFDTMDQNIFNLVRAPSTRELLVREYGDGGGLPPGAPPVMGAAGKIVEERGDRVVVQVVDKTGEQRSVLATRWSEPDSEAAPRLAVGARAVIVAYDSPRAAYVIEDQKIFDGRASRVAGWLTSIFLIGWSVGGFVFGMLGDRIGRTGTMILTILIYAVFTGLSAAVTTWQAYAAMRFLTALGVGGEWAAGAALVAEVFPARSRPMALGLLQALSAVGNMMAAVITLALAGLSWRGAYVVGALPALLVLWIRRTVREPERWQHARQEASAGKELGNIFALFREPVLRRNTIAATLMATAGVGALWGVGFFSTDLVREELQKAGVAARLIDARVSIMFLLQNLGSFFGIYLFASFSERFNRRTAFFFWFVLAWASILIFFWSVTGSRANAFSIALGLAPVMGFCTLGPFSGYTVYFPELFPTRLRATGCGFCYNAARILAAVAPFALGSFKAAGEYAQAATIVSTIYVVGFVGTWMGPETKGKPLPE